MSHTDKDNSSPAKAKRKSSLADDLRGARGATARVEAAAASPGKFLLRLSGDAAWFVIRVVVSIVPMAPLGDRKGHVAKAEGAWNVLAAWISALVHLLLVPYLLYVTATSTNFWAAWPLMAVWLLLGQFWWARRVSAGIRVQEMSLLEYLTAMRALFGGSQARDADGLVIYERPAFKARVAITSVGIGALGMAAAVAGLVLNAVPDTATLLSSVADYLGWAPAVFLGGHFLIAVIPGTTAGLTHGSLSRSESAVEATWRRRLALITGVGERAWVEGGGRFEIDPNGTSISVTLPVQLHGVADARSIETSVAMRANEWTVRSLGFDSLELIRVDTVPEVIETRNLMQASGGFLIAYEDLPDTDFRPQAIRWILNPAPKTKITPDRIDAYALKENGSRLIEFLPHEGTAIVGHLSQEVQDVRGRLASLIGVGPWEIELTVEYGRAENARFVSKLAVSRSPITSRDAEKRRAFWMEQATALFTMPDGHMWRFSEDARTGVTSLSCVHDPLDKVVAYTVDPASEISPYEPWNVGIDEMGEPVNVDLAQASHMLIAGATRSGKSVATYSLLTHVLRMGDSVRLLVADPNDTTVAPFEDIVSWSTSSTHPAAVTEMFEWVRREMDRRKPILREMRQDKVTHFTPEMPMIVVVVDEAANYLKHADKNAAAELAMELQAVAAQGAKYGVRLVIVTQRPSVDILPSAVRSQLSARISFRMEDKEGAVMVFPDIDDATELLSYNTGVGLYKEVAGRPRRFRAAFLDDHWAAADKITRPLTRVEIDGPIAGPVSRGHSQAPPPEVVDVPGEFVFTLDDLTD